MGWVLVRMVEVKVARDKAGLPEKPRCGRESSYSFPRVCSTYRGVINVRNSEGRYVAGLYLQKY